MAQSAKHGQQSPSPYEPGMTLSITNHNPPPPFGSDYENEDTIRRPVLDLPFAGQVDQLDFVLSQPPFETSAPLELKSHKLTIVKKLDRRLPKIIGQRLDRYYGGPHVVRCYLDTDKSRHFVAKIYDGLDYPLFDPTGYDCMYVADQDYSREAAAYQHMPQCLRGSIAPRYFGSWTFEIDTDVCDLRRFVRLILLEYIDGECMLDMILRAKGVNETNLPAELFNTSPIDYQLLPPERERLDVLARIIEADITLLNSGIAHRDISPRNVLITRSSSRPVVLIDFNISRVYQCYKFGREVIKSWGPNPKPISPIQRYWKSSQFEDEFSGWIPQNWLENMPRILNWLCTCWGGSTAFRPLSKHFLSTVGDHPLLRRLSQKTT